VVKNALLTPKKDVNRKVKEAVLALRLEDEMEKDEILERYVNTVYLGNGAYGVQAAAELYFGKDAEQLDLVDAALLAGLISNPSNYDPFTQPEAAKERRRIALDRLVEVGRITRDEATFMAEAPVPSEPQRLLPKPDDYFVEEVKQQLLDWDLLGDTPTDRYNAVFKGGLQIHTTFDPRAQLLAVGARNEVLGSIDDVLLGGADETGRFTAALASVDPRSGAVRAMVGGPGFDKYKYNLATQGLRQGGSSFKVFVLMAALENGFVPDDTINGSSPCKFPNPGGTPDPYEAENFAGSSGGTRTIESQTLSSSNCAYLRLGQAVGLEKVVATAKKMGITSPLEPVLSLPLGVKEVSPLEMASAYGVIANGGVRNEPYYIEQIVDRDGEVSFQHQPAPTRVLGQQTSCLATEVLERNVTGGTGTRARLDGGRRPAAGKTGTAQRFEDAWFAGYTPQLSTAVWIGAPEAKIPMRLGGISVTGGSYPASIWGRFMNTVLEGEPVLDFPECADTRRGESIRLDGDEEEETRRSTRRRRSTPTTAAPAVEDGGETDGGEGGEGGGDEGNGNNGNGNGGGNGNGNGNGDGNGNGGGDDGETTEPTAPAPPSPPATPPPPGGDTTATP
jgi:penicillin-binding protein 1A